MKRKKLIQLLLPLKDKEGNSFPENLYTSLKIRLTDKFGGVTVYARSPATGLWKTGSDRVEIDTIIICEVVAVTFDTGYWLSCKRELEKEFMQEEIMIRSSDIDVFCPGSSCS